MSAVHKRSLQERIADADARGSAWLAKMNEYLERGEHFKAADISSKVQFWLDRSNNLRGCGPLPVPKYLHAEPQKKLRAADLIALAAGKHP